MANSSKENDIFPEISSEELSLYRKQATFDCRILKLSIDKEEAICFKNDIWRIFQNNEIFKHPQETLPLNEQRHLTLKRFRALKNYNISTEEEAKYPWMMAAWNEALFFYDASLAASYSLSYFVFIMTVEGLGTSKHESIVKAAQKSEITGCFALTEVAHGSNVKGMRTTATFDRNTNEFVLHSADFGAAKFWVGLLGKCATHSVVFAKLITPDGQDQGLHAFIVPIRCTQTLKPFDGVTVGDIGEKIGLNGVDNGFIMFDQYHVSRDSLLDKFSSVDARGNFITQIPDYNKRLALTFSVLARGRVCITGIATTQLQKAIIVAVRYSAARKQFGPDDSSKEVPILEYQQQQVRILPYLATAFVLRIFSNWFIEVQTKHAVIEQSMDISKSIEIHGLASSAKPITSWLARDGIQVCREACGGHGYLKSSGFGVWRNDNDANCTYEGENSLLTQQTSNWLLRLWKQVKNGKKITSPYKTVNFLNNYQSILISKLTIITCGDILDPRSLLSCYRWLVCYNLEMTSKKIENMKNIGKNKFEIRNQSQAYHAATLSIAYTELTILEVSYKFVLKIKDPKCKNILLKLLILFGAWSLEKHLGTLYMGSFFSGSAGRFLCEGVISLCSNIKGDAVALVDTISPPDFILNSVLGKSDGKVYQNIKDFIFTNPESFTRPFWWKDVVDHKSFQSKL